MRIALGSDHAGFERQALRRGADLRRTDRPAPGQEGRLAVGASWRVLFPFRGREREALIRVDRLEPPHLAGAVVEGGGLLARSTADCLALSRGTTRLTLTVEVEARTFTARLLLQGMRLARGTLERRAADRLVGWAREVEARSARSEGR